MNGSPGFDRRLTAWLEEQASMREPDRLVAAVTTQVERTRRLPGWAISERWLPMQTRAVLRAVPRTIIILAVLGLLLGVAGAIALAQPQRLPPPVGPAANGLIAYDAQGDIWVANADGTDSRRLTTDPTLDQSPTWSLDGTRLAYWSQDAEGAPSRLVVVDADGSDPITIATDEAGRQAWRLVWSPDGTQVAFSLEAVGPASCPGGYDELCGSRIFVAAANASDGAKQIGDPEIDARNPDWSPDGTTLAFGGSRSGADMGVYLMAPDGSDVRRLSQVLGNGWAFVKTEWSPDGTRIVTMAGTSSGEIWVVAADGTAEVNVSNDPSDELHPTWSPDGEWIAYHRSSSMTQPVIVPAAGGEPRAIDVATEGRTLWSPDGQALIVGRPVGGLDGLVILDAASGAIVAEIPTPGRVHFPSWQRLAP